MGASPLAESTIALSRLSKLAYRAVALAYRQTRRLEHVLADLPVAFYTPALERYAHDVHYAATTGYRTNQHVDLFPFERTAIGDHFPPPPARVLVPGAGGGREMVALARRGYTVHGFDPVPALVDAANRALRDHAGARIDQDTLEAWAARTLAAPEPFAGPYDAILNGWGMWSHLTRHEDRVTALRAFRRACPHGPILLSFDRAEHVYDHEERATVLEPLYPEPLGRIQAITRGWLRRRVLGLPPVERGTRWVTEVYLHAVSEPELSHESDLAGLRVVYYERDGSRFPHAVLVARDQEGSQRSC